MRRIGIACLRQTQLAKGKVKKTISKIKNGKAVGSLGLVSEMVKAAGTQFIVERDIPAEWELSTIVSCCKLNRVASERGNCRGLRLTDWILKITERVTEKLTRQ